MMVTGKSLPPASRETCLTPSASFHPRPNRSGSPNLDGRLEEGASPPPLFVSGKSPSLLVPRLRLTALAIRNSSASSETIRVGRDRPVGSSSSGSGRRALEYAGMERRWTWAEPRRTDSTPYGLLTNHLTHIASNPPRLHQSPQYWIFQRRILRPTMAPRNVCRDLLGTHEPWQGRRAVPRRAFLRRTTR